MPKELEEFAKLDTAETKQGSKKVDWPSVAEQISAANEAYSVREIHEKFVKNVVTLFRTKNALDNLVEKGKLARRYDGKKFWYAKAGAWK